MTLPLLPQGTWLRHHFPYSLSRCVHQSFCFSIPSGICPDVCAAHRKMVKHPLRLLSSYPSTSADNSIPLGPENPFTEQICKTNRSLARTSGRPSKAVCMRGRFCGARGSSDCRDGDGDCTRAGLRSEGK